jgi:hypothetical protein
VYIAQSSINKLSTYRETGTVITPRNEIEDGGDGLSWRSTVMLSSPR